jgi:pectate lyase
MDATRHRFRTGLAGVVSAVAVTAALAGTGNVAHAVGSPTGFGAGTTGGAGGTTVTPTSASQFADYAGRSGKYVIVLNRTITLSSMTKVSSDKTIIGQGTSGRITGSGLNIANATNVIVQNVSFSGSNDDAINVQYSTRVWLDHNDLQAANDGAMDIKRESTNITVSWNRFHNQDKNALLGHSDDNGDEDRGRLRVTYHHNYFDGTNQRNPRVRYGNPVHVYNNYYRDIGDYGVASTVEAGVLVEGNYFENVEDPFHRGEGSSPAGALVARSNHFVNSGSGQTGGTVNAIPYSYSMDQASNVRTIVTNGAGVGKVA